MWSASALLALASATLALAAPSTELRYGRRQIAAVKCPILLDGRVPTSLPLTALDTSNAYFNPDYTKSAQPWSQILSRPANVTPSRFDASTTGPFEVHIDNSSIFQQQYGFRREGLQFAADSPQGVADSGVVTIHWSVKQDVLKPLNLSHEYLNVWHEASDYSANQFNFNAGTRIGSPVTAASKTWQLLNRDTTQLWSTPIDFKNWQNFAVTIDYNANTLTVYTSTGNAALVKSGGPYPNNNAGGGQFQIGILKKPTGATGDITKNGFQEAPFSEGQIYGGLFVENSANGCISL